MYGREYLDWTDRQLASEAVDAFLAAMPAHERKWVLAVLRERFEVRVEYRDSRLLGLGAAQNSLQDSLSHSQARRNVCGQSHFGPISAIARDLGL